MDIHAGDRLRAWRERRGFTQHEAAAHLRETAREMGLGDQLGAGFGQGRISEWERKVAKPDTTGRQVIERATRGKGVIRLRDWDAPPSVASSEQPPLVEA